MIPVALLSAIVFPTLFITDGSMDFSRKGLLAAVPTFIIAYLSRSLIGTILGGMLVFWLAGKF
ncbi:MAG: AzlD domain-containing protein [Desulfobacteraceae bacterium]|jgi:branched-subunit amino acid transport protein